MAKHRASPTCASCHAVMDPLGFALENFDGVGMWRGDKDRFANAPIDSAGELPDGTKINGPDDLRQRPAAPSRSVRADVYGEPLDLLDGPHPRVLRHADRPPDRAGNGGEGLQIFGHSSSRGQKRSVPNAPRSATRAGAKCAKIIKETPGHVLIEKAHCAPRRIEGSRSRHWAAAPRLPWFPPQQHGRTPRAGRSRSASPLWAFRMARSWTDGGRRKPARTSPYRTS